MKRGIVLIVLVFLLGVGLVSASETCDNGIDDDADGLTDCADDDCSTDSYCVDYDLDGYNVYENDCDDYDPLTYPGTTEVCDDGIDNNCNGLVDCADDGCTADIACTLTCTDTDSDNYYVEPKGCDNEVGFLGYDDCNDNDASIWLYSSYYQDNDEDGYGSSQEAGQACTGGTPQQGYALNGDDCDDSDDTIHLGATEVCGDSIDQNCNGVDKICEVCDNGIDEDGDGLIDCADNDCDVVCVIEVCDNLVDDDSDALVDCLDADCAADPFCQAVEGDIDGDGIFDLEVDLSAFFGELENYGQEYSGNADMDEDDVLDWNDIKMFLQIYLGAS